MKLEGGSDLFFLLTVLVPGFIYTGVLGQFVPLRQNSEKALIVLRLLTATAVNDALCSPLIYLLATRTLFPTEPVRQGMMWFVIIFAVPALLGLIRAHTIQGDGAEWLYRLLRLQPISPIPTGWDWKFSRTGPCYLLVTLTDGTVIAGYFGRRSMASSDPDRKDLFIEAVYTIECGNGNVAADRREPWNAHCRRPHQLYRVQGLA